VQILKGENQKDEVDLVEEAVLRALQPSSEELCAKFDASRDDQDELQRLVCEAEAALEAKASDGSFMITKSMGRQKLQHKLKRVKLSITAHLAQTRDERQKEVEREAPVADSVTEDAQMIIQYDEADDIPELGYGCGAQDADGYHGILHLPGQRELDFKKYQLPSLPGNLQRGHAHLFACFPRSMARPDVAWCTTIKPEHFCCDFKEVGRGGARGVRLLSCWGHDPRRPGQLIPSRSVQQRLWKLRPSDITFSQDSVGSKFQDGNSLQDTLEELRSGRLKVEDIEKIKITWHSHWKASPGQPRWWTFTGNRRLTLFRILEREGRLDDIVVEVVTQLVPEWRVSTQKAGATPQVRGKALNAYAYSHLVEE